MAFTLNEIDCGIVTFNPDIERLSENLHAVIDQVALVHVFDNGSDNFDDIVALVNTISATKINLIKGGENFGMAVALNRLCKAALERGQKAIFLLDQDSVASAGLVGALAEGFEPDIAIVAPLIVDRNEHKDESKLLNEDIILPSTITSGTLLDLDAYAATNGYDERLFVDLVDYDISLSLRLAGYRIKQKSSAHLLHELGHKEFVCYFPIRKVGGGIQWKQYRSNHSSFRRYDFARSGAFIIEKYKGTPIYREAKTAISKVIIHNLICEKNKVDLVTQVIKGRHDGLVIAKKQSLSAAAQ